MTQWADSKSKSCDICRQDCGHEFVDGKTSIGPWAIMCLGCHARHGVALGTGRGQHYRWQDGSWRKVAG